MYFSYGEKETAHLKRKDKRLGEAIDRIGPLKRRLDGDVFSSLVCSIIGQQISTKAQLTICNRVTEALGEITPQTIGALTVEEIQRFGISMRKAEYIKSMTDKARQGGLPLEKLDGFTDDEVIEALSALKGVGVWTAQMILTFSMQRPDIVSFGDLAILRGMRMLYRHKQIDRPRFEKYRKRYSPYGTVASLYLWEIAGGAIPELSDPGAKAKPPAKKNSS